MNSEGTPSVGWKWGLGWILMNALSFAFGIAMSQLLLVFVGEVIGFVLFGAIVGLAQWLVLRKLLPGSGWWILVTALALTLGMVGLISIGAVMYWSFYSKLIGFVMLGLTVGLLQTFVLRRYFKGVDFWLLVCMIGWGLGAVVDMIELPLSDYWRIVAAYLLLGLVFGLLSAIFFVVQFRKAREPQLNARVPWVRIGVVVIVLIALIGLPAWKMTTIPQIDQAFEPAFGIEPECSSLPPLMCDGQQGGCAEIVPFEPIEGVGYLNYPVNGETFDNQYRSFLRQDLMMIIQYAAAKVACKTENWTYTDLRPVWLMDMSEKDGSIPGTSIGNPGHPPETHVLGKDLDIAYYHTDVPKVWPWEREDPLLIKGNHPLVICQPTIFGIEVNHCAKMPILLDPWRTALLIAYISENPAIRVIGVDGKVGLAIGTAFDQLVKAGWLTEVEVGDIPLAYEVENTWLGWFYHHHHHMHVSLDVEY